MANITRRKALTSIAAATGVLTTGRLGGALAQSKPPIRIGCIQTMSGPAAEPGEDHVLGARIAIDQINRSGGIDGRMLELVIRDDKLNANSAVAAARELAGDGINLIFGCAFSAPTLAAMPILQGINVVWMSSGPALMSLTHELYNRHYFRIAPNGYMAYRAEARVMAQKYPNVTKWGAIVADSAAMHDINKTFTNALKEYYPSIAKTKAEMAAPILVKVGATDFRNQISALMSSPVEGLLLANAAGDAVTFMQQAQAFGFNEKIKAICDISLNINAGKALGKNIHNHFWSVMTWYPTGYNNAMGQAMYKSASTTQKNPKISHYVPQGHTVIMALASAIRAAKSTETSAVIAALESAPFDSVYGSLRFRKEDHQVLMDQGVVRLGPSPNPPGWDVLDFVVVPAKDAIEPPSPGTAFVEKAA